MRLGGIIHDQFMTNKLKTIEAKNLILKKDGLYYKKNAKAPFTGVSEEFWENGKLKSIGIFYTDADESKIFMRL